MAAVYVLYYGLSDAIIEVDVPAPAHAPARVCDVRKALRAPFQLSGLQMARTELRVVAAGGPQPAPGAISAALAAPYAALDASAPLGSPAAGFGAGAWLVAREVAPQLGAPEEAQSVTAMAGPTFEAEAQAALEAALPEVFPWLRSCSRPVPRHLEPPSEGAREAGLLCVTDADSLLPSLSSAVHGVRLIELGDGVVEPPCEALPTPAGPPGCPPAAGERSSASGPRKCILGEAYSGAQAGKMEAKVAQLDTLVGYMLRRWNDRSPDCRAEDVTQLVGAGVLVFAAGTQPRRQALDSAAALVARVVAGAGCPSLRRLARAGRLVVMVLEQAQCPLTTSQRALAAGLDRLDAAAEKNSEQLEKLTELVLALGERGRGEDGGRG